MTKTEAIEAAISEIYAKLENDAAVRAAYDGSADDFINAVKLIAAKVITSEKYKDHDLNLTLLAEITAEDYALNIEMHNNEDK